ncbi:flagellar FlbD family protein [Pectobacterium betavasculorum]|uniref:flagellar FlbD family protein n=1 Tax=Pectobacterium betavasculorum TaxID=55207 RepID=UPI00313ABFC9
MKIIKLNQQCTIEKQGDYGWVPETIYEPIYIVSDHIETLASHGNTSVKMTSGEKIVVRESVEDICNLLGALVISSNDEQDGDA